MRSAIIPRLVHSELLVKEQIRTITNITTVIISMIIIGYSANIMLYMRYISRLEVNLNIYFWRIVICHI